MKIKDMKQVKEHTRGMSIKRLFHRDRIIVVTLAVMVVATGYLNYMEEKDLINGNTAYEAGAMDISDEDILAENQVTSLAGQSGLQEIPGLDQDPSGLSTINSADDAQATADSGTDTGALAQVGNNATVEGAAQAIDTGQTADTGQMAQAGADGSAQTGLGSPGEAVLTDGMSVTDYITNVQLSREQIRAKDKETLIALTSSASIDETAKQQATQDMIKLAEVPKKESTTEALLMAKGFSDPVVSVTQDKVDIMTNTPSITDPQRAQIEDTVKRKAEAGTDQVIIMPLSMAE